MTDDREVIVPLPQAQRENRRAIVRLDERMVAHMLGLPEGVRILGVRDDFQSMSVLVFVEGDALDPQPEHAMLPWLRGEFELVDSPDDEIKWRYRGPFEAS